MTYHLNPYERDKVKEKGFYVYDMRDSCLDGDGGTIEKYVLVNNCGSIITDKDLHLDENNSYLLLDDFLKDAEELNYKEFCELKLNRIYTPRLYKVSLKYIDEQLEKFNHHDFTNHITMFAINDDKVIAVDNTEGEMFIESFDNLDQALTWLVNDDKSVEEIKQMNNFYNFYHDFIIEHESLKEDDYEL